MYSNNMYKTWILSPRILFFKCSGMHIFSITSQNTTVTVSCNKVTTLVLSFPVSHMSVLFTSHKRSYLNNTGQDLFIYRVKFKTWICYDMGHHADYHWYFQRSITKPGWRQECCSVTDTPTETRKLKNIRGVTHLALSQWAQSNSNASVLKIHPRSGQGLCSLLGRRTGGCRQVLSICLSNPGTFGRLLKALCFLAGLSVSFQLALLVTLVFSCHDGLHRQCVRALLTEQKLVNLCPSTQVSFVA